MLTLTDFDDVAQHDVKWGKWGIPWVDKDPFRPDLVCNVYKEYYLSLGLSYLRQLGNAHTYKEQYRILSPHLGKSERAFLGYRLRLAMYRGAINLRSHTSKSPMKQVDIGPIDVMSWLYQRAPSRLYLGRTQRPIRQRGYIMFDINRIEGWNILDHSFDQTLSYKSCCFSSLPLSEERAEHQRRYDEMLESFDERYKIYKNGGRGWWSKEDTSRVVWRKDDDTDTDTDSVPDASLKNQFLPRGFRIAG